MGRWRLSGIAGERLGVSRLAGWAALVVVRRDVCFSCGSGPVGGTSKRGWRWLGFAPNLLGGIALAY